MQVPGRPNSADYCIHVPAFVFPDAKPVKYKIYSLSSPFTGFDESGQPIYTNDRDYLIKSEEYGVPQNRHRVILLGIRDDLDVVPETLRKSDTYNTLSEVIGGLPKVRSGLSKSYIGSEWIIKDGKKKKKRHYQKIDNTDNNWNSVFQEHFHELSSWSDLKAEKNAKKTKLLKPGSEFVECSDTIDINHPLTNWYTDEKLNGVPNHETRTHLKQDLKRYLFAAIYSKIHGTFPRMVDYEKHDKELLPDHGSATSGKFADRFRVQMPDIPATTVTSHISKDGHYFIHYDENQCRSLTVREAARIQTFPDNYVFCGSRTAQYHQVGNAVPPYLAFQIAKIVQHIR